jgi:hypothetical protein
MTDGLLDDSDLRRVLTLLDEAAVDVDGLTARLARQGWTAERVLDAVGRALDSGRVFEDCRRALQPCPSHAV